MRINKQKFTELETLICNNYCFSTATMVRRTHFSVTLCTLPVLLLSVCFKMKTPCSLSWVLVTRVVWCQEKARWLTLSNFNWSVVKIQCVLCDISRRGWVLDLTLMAKCWTWHSWRSAGPDTHGEVPDLTLMANRWTWHSWRIAGPDTRGELLDLTLVAKCWTWHSWRIAGPDTHGESLDLTLMANCWTWHSWRSAGPDTHGELLDLTLMANFPIAGPAIVTAHRRPYRDLT
jgi:hypothetical protein